jgi:hypothetical protein
VRRRWVQRRALQQRELTRTGVARRGEGVVDLAEGRHARRQDHRLAVARDARQERQVGELAGADLEGGDVEVGEHLRALLAQLTVRRFDELDGFGHRYEPGCFRGGENPRGGQTQAWIT